MIRALLPALLATASSLAMAATPMVSEGNFHSLAVTADGSVLSWGQDVFGQLGLGRKLVSTLPAEVALPNVVSVSSGCDHTLAARGDGTVWAWGSNVFGQLGDGTQDDRTDPVQVPGLANVVTVVAGCDFSLALQRDGTAYSWGLNSLGQLGNGGTSSSAVPVPVAGSHHFVEIVTGGSGNFGHAIGLDDQAIVWGWGGNLNCEIDPAHCQVSAPVPTFITSKAVAIAAGIGYSAAAMKDGSVWVWGGPAYGILAGAGPPNLTIGGGPFLVGGLDEIVALAGGGNHVLALRKDGTVWAWGRNESGQLGDATQSLQRLPAQVKGISGVKAIAAGFIHSVALKSDGTVWAWGSNLYGELGDGTQADRLLPIEVAGLSGVDVIAAANGSNSTLSLSSQTFAIRSDHTLWAWGSDSNGQLATGGDLYRAVPTKVPGLAPAAMVSAGFAHSAAVDVDGNVWTWGDNTLGELGDGTNVGRSSPTRVTGISGVKQVACAGRITLALKADGTLWWWGDGAFAPGGSRPTPYVPTQLTGVAGAVALSTFAVARSDGSVIILDALASIPGLQGRGIVAFGANTAMSADGSVYLVTFAAGSVFTRGDAIVTQVAGVHDAIAVAGNYIVRADGSAATLGSDQQLSPVAGLPPITSISGSSGATSLAVTRDGKVLGWGYNRYGEVGDGTLVTRLHPVVVLSEGGGGGVAGGDWFLRLDPSQAPSVPPELVPPMLAVVTGGVQTKLDAAMRFRPSDIGHPIHVFAYAPASLVKSTRIAKDGSSCVLAQLGPSGLQQVSAGNLASVGNVTTSQGQAVAVLRGVNSSQVVGATFCVGSGETGLQSADPSNHQCVATVPGASACLPEATVAAAPTPPGALTGLWWNPNESGWGVHFTQRGANVFVAWYTYDASGNPKWYVASNCAGATGTSGTCSGTAYEVNGPRFFGTAFAPITAAQVSSAGSLQVAFADANSATFTYSVAGVSRSVPIVRQLFPVTPTAPPSVDYTDLWWNPGEAGWGMAISHQYGNIFLAWYVYDGGGKPMWYVASNCMVTANGCSGTLYRTTGPAFGTGFDPRQVQVFTVGSASIAFSDANHGTLSYTVDGQSGTKNITRELF